MLCPSFIVNHCKTIKVRTQAHTDRYLHRYPTKAIPFAKTPDSEFKIGKTEQLKYKNIRSKIFFIGKISKE